jgi:hypothetical protein
MSDTEALTICPNAVRPTCRTCGVQMWLVKIDRKPGKILSEAMHFQCTVCLAEQTVAPEPTASASLP